MMRPFVYACVIQVTLATLTWAQEQSVNPGINDSFKNPDLKQYQSRFEREGRDVFDHQEEVVEACQLRSGMAVADIGAGTGLFTRKFAERVGPQGHVFAVDIARNFVTHIENRSAEAGQRQVTGVICEADDVLLPENSVDLVFVCDTYHHFEFPTSTLKSIHRALKPDGRLIVIDFHRIEGETREWLLDHVRAGEEVFTEEIVDAGFERIDRQTFMKENYLLVFRPSQ